MSADDEDDKVGYGRPPKNTRFKPGQSGNPRGRRPQIPRADIESQIGKDLRRIMNQTVKLNGKQVPLLSAILSRLVRSALDGKASSMKHILDLLRLAYRENSNRKPDLMPLEGLDFEYVLRDPRLREVWLPLLKELAKLSREP